MRSLPLAMLSLALAAPAFANDSSAELTTGGLVLTRSADIEMRSEDLSISQQEIVVRYIFFNRGAADQTVTVAFPLPDIVWEGPDTVISVPDSQSANFLDFKTLVAGAPVEMRLEQKAFSGARDITAQLTKLGVPLAPQRETTWKALDALPKAVQDELLKTDLAIPDDYDAGKGPEHHLSPHWTLKTAYYWNQTFPAGRELAVEHRYKPSVGGTVGTSLQIDPVPAETWRDYQPRYCIDSAFMASVRTATGARGRNGSLEHDLFERRIGYVLTTGANWAGPIGDFHLTVDKGAPTSLVSFCADGVKKISPTQFEVRHTNFTPNHDLDILILYSPQK